jgi:hypothetical protein
MNINVNVNVNNKKENQEYSQMVADKIRDLGGLPFIVSWENKPEILICRESFNNRKMFIICGILQIILQDMAYFGSGVKGLTLYLQLDSNLKSWQEVWEILKDIESLNYTVNK